MSGEDGRIIPDRQPRSEELQQAFQAGFRSIDEGEGFYSGFHAHLDSLGYRKRDDIDCTCADGGEHGHLPECRWVLMGGANLPPPAA